MHFYRAFGLNIKSDIPLRGFREIKANNCQIAIRRIISKEPKDYPQDKILSLRTKDGIICSFPNKVEYFISKGKEIHAISGGSVNPQFEAIPIYGFAIASLLQQRNKVVFHASAVEINNKAIIIAGRKAFGKSTTVAKLLGNGYKLLSDDITSVSLNSNKEIMVESGIPVLKMWPDAIQKSGLNSLLEDQLFPGTKKRICLLKPNDFSKKPIPLDSMIIISGNEVNPKLKPIVDKFSKFQSLFSSEYFYNYPHLFTKQERDSTFKKIAKISSKTKVYNLSRPNDKNTLNQIVAMIKEL